MMRAWGLMLWAALLVACAQPSPVQSTGEATQDLVTRSDESAHHRRARIRTELATGYLQRGQAEVALDEAKLALGALETYVPAHMVKALAYMALNRADLARVSLDRALALAPADVDVLINDAWWYCGQGQTTQALAGFDRALVAGAGPRAWLGKGVCTARSGGDATPWFERAYALAPRDAQVLTAWAEYATQHQDWAKTHELLTPFNAGLRATASTLSLQAQAYRQQGDLPRARALQRRLLAAYPDSAEAQTLRQERGHD